MKFQGNLLEVLKVWLLKVEANVKLLHNWNTIISNYTGVFQLHEKILRRSVLASGKTQLRYHWPVYILARDVFLRAEKALFHCIGLEMKKVAGT